MSISDIHRLLLVAQRAAERGTFSAEDRADFSEAADILFVRKNNFRRVLKAGEALQSAQEAIVSLDVIVDVADGAIAAGLTDAEGLFDRLLNESEEARQKLVSADRAYTAEDMILADRLAQEAAATAELAAVRTESAKAAAVNLEMRRGIEALTEEMRRAGDNQ